MATAKKATAKKATAKKATAKKATAKIKSDPIDKVEAKDLSNPINRSKNRALTPQKKTIVGISVFILYPIMALSLLALATQLLIGENKVDSKSEPVIDRKEQHLRALERKINTKVLDVYSALENYRNTSFAIPFFIPAFEESKVSTAIKLSDKGSTLDIEIPNPINSWAKFDGFYCNLITESIYNDVLDNLLKSQNLLLFNSLKRVNISINYLEYSSDSAKDKYSNPIPMKQLGKFGSDKISFKMSEITAINSEYFDPNYFDPIKISEPNSVRYANNPTICKDRR